jgi:protoporphyrinogen oxidase
VLGIKGDPEMVYIHRHKHGLPLYHGSYQLRTRAIMNRLDQLPGLHITANYLGGVSVRDRILCAQSTADRISTTLKLHG